MHTLGFGESEASVVDELFTKYDTDGNGKLSVKEFIVFCNQMVEKEHVSVEVPEGASPALPPDGSSPLPSLASPCLSTSFQRWG